MSFSNDASEILCFSKKFNDNFNPKNNFAAIMTCSSAEKNCPFISGSDKIISMIEKIIELVFLIFNNQWLDPVSCLYYKLEASHSTILTWKIFLDSWCEGLNIAKDNLSAVFWHFLRFCLVRITGWNLELQVVSI